ncbi:hypothetical protein SRB17_30870 [Streptomyces sp. RB17]|nr:hypothetical protein [Streptomyces sp. RB17]
MRVWCRSLSPARPKKVLDDPQAGPVRRVTVAVVVAEHAAAPAHEEYRGPEGWAQVQRHGTWLTREELLAFMREYHALLDRYGHPREEAPDGARPVLMRFYAVPEPVVPESTSP